MLLIAQRFPVMQNSSDPQVYLNHRSNLATSLDVFLPTALTIVRMIDCAYRAAAAIALLPMQVLQPLNLTGIYS